MKHNDIAEHSSAASAWTIDQLGVLRRLADAGATPEIVGVALARSVADVKQAAATVGIAFATAAAAAKPAPPRDVVRASPPRRRPGLFTAEMDATLREIGPVDGFHAVAEKLGLKPSQVHDRAKKLGVRSGRACGQRAPGAPPKGWTAEQIADLRQASIDRLSANEFARICGKTRHAVWNMADRLSITLRAEPAGRRKGTEPDLRVERPVAPPPPVRAVVASGDAWSDADLATLRKMAGDALSAREIAQALGRTRNAVLGKANRLHIQLAGGPGRPGRTGPKPRLKIVAREKPVAKAPPKPSTRLRIAARADGLEVVRAQAAAGDFPHKTTLFGLTTTACRFPLWGADRPLVEEAFYCGAPQAEGCGPHPYCAGHAAMCLAPLERAA